MNKKIICLIVLLFLVSLVYSDGDEATPEPAPEPTVDIQPILDILPPDEPLSEESITIDNFDLYYEDNPIIVARENPQLYLQYITENSVAVPDCPTCPRVYEEVTTNPEAYAAVIAQDVTYINQNKDAFVSWMGTQGINFDSIKGDIFSFDSVTGRFTTTVSSQTVEGMKTLEKKAVTSFTVEELTILTYKKRFQLEINEQGELLIYDGVDLRSSIQGRLETAIGPYGSDSIILTDGKVYSGQMGEIKIAGNNRAIYNQYGALEWEFEVVDHPIILSSGILIKGFATFYPSYKTKFTLYNSVYQSKLSGTTFTVTETTIVDLDNRNSNCNNNEILSLGCIKEREIDGNIDLILSANNIKIHNNYEYGNIKIDAEDGVYRNIIVKQIKDELPQVEIGSSSFYIDAEGNIYNIVRASNNRTF